MGFILDPPSTRGQTIQEQLRDIRDWCIRCTDKLNHELNNLSSKNFTSAEARTLSNAMDTGLGDISERVKALSRQVAALQEQINTDGG